MGLQLSKLQDNNEKAKALRAGRFPEDWKDVEGIFQYQGLLYIPKIFRFEMISCHHNNLFTKHFEIDKIQELVAKKYYWSTFYHNIKTYI